MAGWSGRPRGKPPGTTSATSDKRQGRPPGSIAERRRPASERPSVILWDLQQAAKDKSKRGLEILTQCMEDTTADWNTRLKAVELLWERGYGRPQQSIDMNLNHNFAEVPAVMGLDQWLERKGQPVGHDAWLLEHQKAKGTQTAAPTGKRTSEPPSAQAGHPERSSKGSGPVLDLTAEDPLLTAVDPTEPPPPGKLN